MFDANTIDEPIHSEINISLDEYPQSWYPICLSKSLKPNKIMLQRAFGKEWVLFRNRQFQVAMLPRHCLHMGTDLINGRIVDGLLECPLHRWCYDAYGNSMHLKQESRNTTKFLHTKEAHGIIFAFWGNVPNISIPSFEHLHNPVISEPIEVIMETSLIMMSANTFDLKHYLPVHQRKLEGKPMLYQNHSSHLGLIYEASVQSNTAYDRMMMWLGQGRVTNQIDCYFGNNFKIASHSTHFSSIVMALPIDTHQTRIFLISACAGSKHSWKRCTFDKFKAQLGRIFTLHFIKADIRIAKNMRPRFDHADLKQDQYLMKFFSYWQQLPKWRCYE